MRKHLRLSVLWVVLGFMFLIGSIDFSYYFRQVSILWSPTMTFETLSVDFGDVSNAVDVRREMTVKNTGRNPLVLEKVLPSCYSCIVIHSYTKEPIPSGAHGNIDFSLNISNRQGKVQTSFLVISNAVPVKSVVIEVAANVLTESR